jgi:hypothetical protein
MDQAAVAEGLLRELKATKLTWLPPYNHRAIDQVVKHMNELIKALRFKLQQLLPFPRGSVPLRDAAMPIATDIIIRRNKRCVLAYLMYRINKIRDLYWETAGVMPPQLAERLSVDERAFAQQYSQLITQYMQDTGSDLLVATQPPQSNMIHVKVLQPLGQVVLPSGTIAHLAQHTRLLMQRTDAELLIRQGALEHVDHSMD